MATFDRMHMEYTKFRTVSRLPLIIVTVVFIIIVIIVGVVTWKITKDAFEDEPHVADVTQTEAPRLTPATASTQEMTPSPQVCLCGFTNFLLDLGRGHLENRQILLQGK